MIHIKRKRMKYSVTKIYVSWEEVNNFGRENRDWLGVQKYGTKELGIAFLFNPITFFVHLYNITSLVLTETNI